MPSTDFENIINLVGPKIMKNYTHFRQAISVQEKVALTLRFLATGDSYTSLQYLFKISKQGISEIAPHVCQAIIEAPQNNIQVS